MSVTIFTGGDVYFCEHGSQHGGPLDACWGCCVYDSDRNRVDDETALAEFKKHAQTFLDADKEIPLDIATRIQNLELSITQPPGERCGWRGEEDGEKIS